MIEFNQTDELTLADLDGTEQVLILKDGKLYRVSTAVIAVAPAIVPEPPAP